MSKALVDDGFGAWIGSVRTTAQGAWCQAGERGERVPGQTCPSMRCPSGNHTGRVCIQRTLPQPERALYRPSDRCFARPVKCLFFLRQSKFDADTACMVAGRAAHAGARLPGDDAPPPLSPFDTKSPSAVVLTEPIHAPKPLPTNKCVLTPPGLRSVRSILQNRGRTFLRATCNRRAPTDFASYGGNRRAPRAWDPLIMSLSGYDGGRRAPRTRALFKCITSYGGPK